MQIKSNEIHVWSITLGQAGEENKSYQLLSLDERERAERFHFPIHKERFIAARSTLRRLLSLYLEVPPGAIVFGYTKHNKPYLLSPANTRLAFNASHSNDRAIYAFSLDHAVGIDIEKVGAEDKQAIAERFFSPQENGALRKLSAQDQLIGFYRLWSRKEALIKAIGKGLSIPLSSFSVSLEDTVVETISLENRSLLLISLRSHEDYQAALATENVHCKTISYWQFFNFLPKLEWEHRL